MKKKGNFRKVVSGLLAGMTMLSTVLSPMTAYAVIGDNTVLSIVMPASNPDTTFLKLPFFFMLRSSLS